MYFMYSRMCAIPSPGNTVVQYHTVNMFFTICSADRVVGFLVKQCQCLSWCTSCHIWPSEMENTEKYLVWDLANDWCLWVK